MAKKNYVLEKRKFVIGGIALLIVIIYGIRLFTLQILSDTYKTASDNNAFLYNVQYPARGAIYDRSGKLMVFNQSAYDITFIPREIVGLDTLEFCRTLNITQEYFERRMQDVQDRRLNPGYSRYTNQVFMTQLSAEETGEFQEKLYKFQGFDIQRRTIRQYNYATAAHVLGDIGEVSKTEMETDPYYARGDYIGKLGVEKSYETYLRGEKGVEVLLRDARGRIQGSYNDGADDKLPVAGKNLTLSLDVELQMFAEQLMQGKMGAIVAIEPETGEILCMLSAPDYDPAMMVGRKRGNNQLALQDEPTRPLFNRAIMAAYPPGSTFKTAQALTFLQENIVDTQTAFPCYGAFIYGGLRVGCHAHPSPISVIPALSTSCNAYFCWGLVRMLASEKYNNAPAALNKWRDYMVSMGLGYNLGIDLPGEKRGLIPNGDYYTKRFGTERWGGLRIISTAIGQGEILATPVQICNLAATIANRGHFITPHVVKSIEGAEMDSLYRTPRYTDVSPENYEYIVQGMRGAVVGSAYGSTCRRANIPGLEICGKTGTAQNVGKDHSIFMGFAPMSNPKIAVSVYVENGGFGATWAVPMGALLIEKYLTGKIAPERQYLVDEITKANLIPYAFKQ